MVINKYMIDPLQADVLVLDKTWRAVKVIKAPQAIIKVVTGKAKAIDDNLVTYNFNNWVEYAVTHTPNIIHTVHLSIPVPEIIVISGKARLKSPSMCRKNLFIRDKYTCQYCGKKPGSKELTLDHVHPKSRGGKMEWTNIVLSCLKCNNRKRDRTPAEANMPVLTPPVKAKWSDIFIPKTEDSPVSWDSFVSDIYWNIDLE